MTEQTDWQQCRIGSCQRHQRCMYAPCRRLPATPTQPATDKPEAVAWLYEIPGANIRYAYAQRRDCFAEGWTETPLYPEPPSQPDASALVALQQALVNHNDVLRSAYQIAARQGNSTDWDGFTKRAGSVLHFHHDEVNAARAAIAAMGSADMGEGR